MHFQSVQAITNSMSTTSVREDTLASTYIMYVSYSIGIVLTVDKEEVVFVIKKIREPCSSKILVLTDLCLPQTCLYVCESWQQVAATRNCLATTVDNDN